MGCCCSEPEDPLMEQYRRAKDFASKAQIILQLATKEEKFGRIISAIQHYGTHLRCMAVHLFKEFDRKKKNEMLNVASSCRRIYAHRAALQQRALRAYPGGCCSDPYIPTDPAAPAMLAPWEWSEFLIMCKSSGCIEAALQKMGLLKIETKETVATRIAEAGRSSTNVAVSNQVSPHINVNPTITGPTTTISGPSTNISGPNTTTTVSPNMNNAQTGEGNVAPATGTGAGSSGAGAASATATGGAPQPAMQPGMQPGMQSVGMQPSPGYMMMPTPSGQWVMVPMAGSGDYAAAAAAAAAQQQQQQQLMQMAASGGQAMFMPPGGMVGGMPPPNAMPYMMPAHSGGYYPMPGMPQMAAGGPVAGAPVAGFPAPAPAGYPPPPEGYPPPAAGKVMPAEPVKVAAA